MGRPAALRILLLVAVLSLTLAGSASAAQTITVSATTADTVDPSPADGTCDAPCTLRAAVQTANGAGSPGADTIVLSAGNYERTVGGADGGDPAATGDLDVTEGLTITGDGQATTTVDANDLERVFDIHPGVTATISGLTITGGLATDGDFTTAGGGVRVGIHQAGPPTTLGAATLTVNDATVVDNSAQDGSGLATDSDGANLTLNRVTVADNIASAGSTEGGGVNERWGGTVAINNSVVRGNSADSGGGVTDDGAGTITITDSTITENNNGASGTGQGGGVEETGGGNVTLIRTLVSKNSSAEGGGVVEDGGGNLTLVDSTVRENFTTGGFDNGGGVLMDGGGTTTLRNSLIVGNTAGEGAGINVLSGDLDVRNSTVTGNGATGRGGGLQTQSAGTTLLSNVTFSANTASTGGATIDNCTGPPGCAGPAHTITARNTIVTGAGTNCFGAVTSGGHNIDSGTTCGFGGTGDQGSTDPLLAAPADNGGPTLTQSLLDGSPAIDRGDPATCEATDQRGITRPAGPACDIGAFERVFPAPGGPPQTPATSPQTPVTTTTTAGTPCNDKLAPVTTLKRGGLKLARGGGSLSLRGTSRDRGAPCPSGLRNVQVSLARVKGRTGTNCRFLRTPRRYSLTKPKNCRRPTLFTAKGTDKWTFKFPVRLKPGLYRAQVRATDKASNKETPRKGRSIVFFTVR